MKIRRQIWSGDAGDFQRRGRTSKGRPLTTLAAFRPCSGAEGSSRPARSFGSILAQAASAARCAAAAAAVGVAKQRLTGGVEAEDERAAKGKRERRRRRRRHSTFNTSPQLGAQTDPAGKCCCCRDSHRFQSVVISVAAG